MVQPGKRQVSASFLLKNISRSSIIIGSSFVEDDFNEGLAADWTGVVGAFGADAAATEEEFATLGCFHRFRAGIAILDTEDFGSAVRTFDGLATDRYCRIVDVNGFLQVIVVSAQEVAGDIVRMLKDWVAWLGVGEHYKAFHVALQGVVVGIFRMIDPVVANPHSQLEMLISRELVFCSLYGHPLFLQWKDFVKNLEGFFFGYRNLAGGVLWLGIILYVHGDWGCLVQM